MVPRLMFEPRTTTQTDGKDAGIIMIVAELFILRESISVQRTPQYFYLLHEYSRGMGVVVDQPGTCQSIVSFLWVQCPLLFVLYSSLPEPISPEVSLTTAPASDWFTAFFAILKISIVIFMFREPSFQPLCFQGFCLLLAISAVLTHWLTILAFALVSQSLGNAEVWTTSAKDSFFSKKFSGLDSDGDGAMSSFLFTSSPQAPQQFPVHVSLRPA